MRASQLGCARSYARLLTEIAGAVRQLAAGDLKRLGIEAGDVEDIVQETLLAIHVKQATWDAGRPFIPWVRAIARHKTRAVYTALHRGLAALAMKLGGWGT